MDEYFRWQDPKTRLENQLRLLYGRGDITKERYLELRYRLYFGQLGQGDLILLRDEVARKNYVNSQAVLLEPAPQIQRLLDRLYGDRVLVEEARATITEKRKLSSAESEWAAEQAEIARKNARAALPDETLARNFLGIWQEMLHLSQVLKQDDDALLVYDHRLELMEAELKAKIARLKLLDTQAHLSELDSHLFQDLISNTS